MDIKDRIDKIARVLMIASKPDKQELTQSAKITGAGIAAIGLAGFIIFVTAMLLSGAGHL
ncbi:MAG: protein translocase SEC61 complex subunit gamma [Candidatus Aenigmarchaeota archaeon]|nr:protein translocase SEC61 complex subunit gamma [Candidatus Aenigmarchaeota archaeon]